jgi:hypothetical protein
MLVDGLVDALTVEYETPLCEPDNRPGRKLLDRPKGAGLNGLIKEVARTFPAPTKTSDLGLWNWIVDSSRRRPSSKFDGSLKNKKT